MTGRRDDRSTDQMTAPRTVEDLPSALDGAALSDRLAGRRPAVFLDYDGVLTPIVARPEDAVWSDAMRRTVRELADRVSVCIVTGRDRDVVQQLMGVDDLVVAGSHGFDIWSPTDGQIAHDVLDDFTDLITETTETLRTRLDGIDGVGIEPKRASVAVHYRQASPEVHDRVGAIVETLLQENPERLAVVPGKMVYELKPAVDWNKGKAVLHLIEVLGLASDEVVPLYLGDDITDEDAFRALRGRGIGILVGSPDDPEMAGRRTDAEFVLASVDDVERFLSALGR
ncbi:MULTISPECIES: trehalose-phosphatase [Rhodococcus]|uniref:Trehalose 6-phosphate phosphatase n=1 Tax=Rhodococcus rhodochrous TaxID=1829 RepID=A0AAW4XJX7_RHORH|nr:MULTISPECIES: trehalose-phosphatase [Rhodococcus]MCD2113346.1 trehalose-phosphatase [Rhodococcus rhodochrous]WAL44476.1 trehalose-phosphatase [Rhodococcus pyridinivorans]